MAENKVISLKELIQNKVKYERKNGGEKVKLHLERLDGEIVIETPTKELCLDVMDMTRDDETAKNADAYMVYSMILEPNLKDKELQKAYECDEPTDIVEKIFTLGEIGYIVNKGFESAGFDKGSVSVVEEVKN